MNIIKKIRNLKYYIKQVNKYKKELFDIYNVKVDNIFRLYTVYNIDENEYNTYGGDKPVIAQDNSINSLLMSETDTKLINGEDIFKIKVDKELKKLDNFLINEMKLIEMYGYTQKRRLDKLNYLVVIEFKFLSTKLLANMAIIFGIITISSIIIGAILGSIMLFL